MAEPLDHLHERYKASLADKADVPRVIKEWLEFDGPAFLEVMIDPDAGVYPMVPPGAGYDAMITGDHIRGRQAPAVVEKPGAGMF